MSVTKSKVFAAAIAAATLFTMTSANAWWGPGGPGAWGGGPGGWGWDPQEAYLDEYGFFDRYGPSSADFRRMHRDNWDAAWGYPVRRGGLGPWGPSLSDIRRQQQRKWRRMWGYPY